MTVRADRLPVLRPAALDAPPTRLDEAGLPPLSGTPPAPTRIVEPPSSASQALAQAATRTPEGVPPRPRGQPAPHRKEPLSDSPPDLPPGYRFLSILGKGGMGVVYLALDLETEREVALKQILDSRSASDDDRRRFLTEVEALRAIQHPGIVQILHSGTHDGEPFYVLEYCPRGSLKEALAHQPMPPRDAAVLVEQIARAIHAAHVQGVIHRDLKPSNVLLDEDGAPRVSDFGLARLLHHGAGLTTSGMVMGTPEYMAPEQARGEARTAREPADTWALGAILYECLTGRPPFQGAQQWATLAQVINDDPVSPQQLNPLVQRDLQTITLKCLNKRPDRRYQSALALAEDLRRWRMRQPIVARPPGVSERLLRWARRSPLVALAVAVGISSVLGLLSYLVLSLRLERLERLEQERLMAEGKRLMAAREEFTNLYFALRERARKARPDHTDTWREIKVKLTHSLDHLREFPALADHPHRPAARGLLTLAREHVATADRRKDQRDRLARLSKLHGDAVYFATFQAGDELPEGLPRIRRAAEEGLALFFASKQDGRAQIDARFFTPDEVRRIERCGYELLLLAADALAWPRGAEAERRLRKALGLLGEAERLVGGATPFGVLRRRADFHARLGQKEQARLARIQLEKSSPRLAADHFLAGLEHYQRNEIAQAIDALMRALRQQEDHLGAEYVLALCRLRQGAAREAWDGFGRCLKHRPDFLWATLERGHAAMELGWFADAQETLDSIPLDHPDLDVRYVVLVNRGVLAHRLGRDARAIAFFQEAIRIGPRQYAADVSLASILRGRGELGAIDLVAPWGPHGGFVLAIREVERDLAYRESVRILDSAIRRLPRVGLLYHERAKLLLRLGERDRAMHDLVQAIDLDGAKECQPRKVENLLTLGRLLHQAGDHQGSLERLQEVKRLEADNLLADRLMAEPLVALGRDRDAARVLDRFVNEALVGASKLPAGQRAPLMAGAYRLRALLHIREGRLERAIHGFTQGLKWQRDLDLVRDRGGAYLLWNKPAEARSDFEVVLKERPDDAQARLGQAEGLVRQGKIEQALEAVNLALARRAEKPQVPYRAARVYALVARAKQRGPGHVADRYESQAVDQVKKALLLVPVKERSLFWRDHVEQDGVLQRLRGNRQLRRLVPLEG